MTTTNEVASLFIVSTPIGNLEDITFRAISVLKSVNLIAAEDTRHSRMLLNKYDIKTNLISLHDHNEQIKSDDLIDKLLSGVSIALISDAGTPLINDPGYHLVKKCHQMNIKVVPIPGACAAIAALSVSGLPTNKFTYEGFLQAKSKARIDQLNDLKNEARTIVFYESTHRLIDALTDIKLVFGEDRIITLAKELTKAWEKIINGTVDEVITWLLEKPNRCNGEFVIMVEGKTDNAHEKMDDATILLKKLMAELPLKKATSIVSEFYGIKKNTLYQLGLSLKSAN